LDQLKNLCSALRRNGGSCHKFISDHAFIHLEVLCSKFLRFKHILYKVTKNAHQWNIQKVLEDVEAEYSDLISYMLGMVSQ